MSSDAPAGGHALSDALDAEESGVGAARVLDAYAAAEPLLQHGAQALALAYTDTVAAQLECAWCGCCPGVRIVRSAPAAAGAL
jgi:hypothetical protein